MPSETGSSRREATRRRRTSRLGAVVLTALLWTSGCAVTPSTDRADSDSRSSAPSTPSESPDPSASSEPSSRWGSCTPQDLDAADGPSGKLAIQGGGSVRVTFVPAGTGACEGALVARGTEGGLSGVDVSRMDLDQETARVVSPAGDDAGQLLRIDSAPHPRGGFQPHLFAATDAGLAEVGLDGRPVLPFVSTDGGALPMTATCPDGGGLRILSGSTSKPPGILLAWDVRSTTYDITDGEAVETSTSQVEDHAADPLLREQRPELFDTGSLFSGCSQPWGA